MANAPDSAPSREEIEAVATQRIVAAARKWIKSLLDDGWDDKAIKSIARPGIAEMLAAIRALDRAREKAGG